MGLVIGTGGLHIGTSGGGASPVKRFDAEAEYIKRKAGGTDNIGTGKAKIPTLKGKSLVWNQLVQNGNFNGNINGWYCDDTSRVSIAYGQNSLVATILTSGNGGYRWGACNYATRGIISHKYYLSAQVKGNGITSFRLEYSNKITTTVTIPDGAWSAIKEIVAITESPSTSIYIEPLTVTENSSYEVKNVMVIDLTILFGSGNEPSTVEEFEAMYPLPYYEYNPGEIINNEAEAIETVGFNQWDEEWEVGGYNTETGEKNSLTDRIRSKNFIPVISGQTYFFKNGDANLVCLAYDAQKNFTGEVVYKVTSQPTYTIPSNVKYIRFYMVAAYGTTYNNDICINLSDPAKNGTYEPYEKHTLQLGLNSFDVKDSEGNVITVNGLKSAGSVFDEIDLARGKYIKRVGEVDMGTLTWGYSPQADYANSYRALNTPVTTTSNGSNGVCKQYIVGIVAGSTAGAWIRTDAGDRLMSIGNGNIALTDYRFERDAAALKAALSGVLLYYELAEPVEYDLVTPIGNSYKVISGGTEERLPRDTASSVMAPIKYSVKYVQPKE